MPRPRKNFSNLTLAELEQILESRRSELTELEERREEARQHLDEIDAEIAVLNGTHRSGRPGRPKGSSRKHFGGTGVTVGRPAGRGTSGRNAVSLPEAIVNVLAKRSEPMNVAKIIKAVLKSGYVTNSENFRSIVNQAIIKDNRFIRVARGMYQLNAKTVGGTAVAAA